MINEDQLDNEQKDIAQNEVAETPAPVKNPDDWVTEHFSRKELIKSSTAARLGIDNTPSTTEWENIKYTAQQLEKIRAYVTEKLGKETAVIVSSCFRCMKLNRAVGGSVTSAHCHGLAADFDIAGLTSPQTAKLIREMRSKGLIDYDQLILEYPKNGNGAWVHIGFKAGGKGHRHQELTATRVNGKTVYSAGLLA